MDTTTPPPPLPPRPPAPTPIAARPPAREPAAPWLKVLIGCGIGCGVLVLIAIAVGLYGVWWVVSPGDQIASESVVGDDSMGVVHLAGDRAVSGLGKLIGHVFSEAQRLQNERTQDQLPEAFRWLQQMQQMQQQQATAQGMGIWVPRELTLSVVEGGQSESIGFVVAFNMRQLVRPFRSLILTAAQADDGGPTTYHHGDYEIVEFDKDATLCFHGGTVLLADTVDTMRRTLDQIDATHDPSPQPEQQFSGYAQLKDRWALLGVLDSRAFQDAAVTSVVAGKQHDELDEILRRATRMSFGMEISSADSVHGELSITMPDAADLPQLAAAVQARLQELESKLTSRDMHLEHELTEHDNSLLVSAEVNGLAAAITRLLENLDTSG